MSLCDLEVGFEGVIKEINHNDTIKRSIFKKTNSCEFKIYKV